MARRSNRRKSHKPMIIFILLMMMVGLIFLIGAKFYKDYNNPSIVGKWISQETEKTIEFTEDGVINVDNLKTGEYEIESPGLITYVVEGHTFQMNYSLSERVLIWGLSGDEEYFKRKGL